MRFKLIMVFLVLFVLPGAALIFALGMNRPMWSQAPGFTERLKIYLMTNTAETVARPRLPELRLRSYRVGHEEMVALVGQVLGRLPRWKVVLEEPEAGVFQAEVTSRIWRFRDDLFVLVNTLSPEEVEVYLYSASRNGKWDLGANRDHILTFYDELEVRLKEGGRMRNVLDPPTAGSDIMIPVF